MQNQRLFEGRLSSRSPSTIFSELPLSYTLCIHLVNSAFLIFFKYVTLNFLKSTFHHTLKIISIFKKCLILILFIKQFNLAFILLKMSQRLGRRGNNLSHSFDSPVLILFNLLLVLIIVELSCLLQKFWVLLFNVSYKILLN